MHKINFQEESALKLISQLILEKTLEADVTSIDTAEIAKIAVEHGVAALLFNAIKSNPNFVQLANALSSFQTHQDLRNQLLDKHYMQALHALSNANIKYVVLKGFALGQSVYPSHLYRTKSDVDIIIAPGDYNTINNVFESLEYRNPRGWTPTEIINQFSMRKTLSPGLHVDFDIHLHLSNELGVEDILTFDELAEAADNATLVNIPLVSKPHALIHAIVHLLHHRNVGDTVKLIWLYDLYLLCQKMSNAEQQQFIDSVDIKGLSKLAKFALSLAYSYFEDECLQAFINGLHDKRVNPKLDYLVQIDSRSSQFFRSLRQRRSVSEKWFFIKEMAFPPAAEIYRKYGKQPKYLLPIFYFRRIFGGIIKHL
ncbi:nucleotidyltransferase family protein [Aliiglaciecola lipolytica]|uniref:Nucleotidyltransferase family protein n=1 Tax=Aliiglaciecola lipolytica E3 TaxID=1127673 RepID=K6YNJ3_9ALTE|nr:nucleotidyltransferase family protein [Aliiglaciecola lipolytica]GAC12895.1 hypothetical protein GLIP_0241 [Aliiglaciecola lipolytica E3]